MPFYQGKKDFEDVFLQLPTVWTTSVIKFSKKSEILISVRAPVGNVNIHPFDEICIERGLVVIRCEDVVQRDFIFY